MRHFGIFAKEPVAGRVKTRLATTLGDQAAAELYRAFLRDLTERFRDTADVRWIGFTPNSDAALMSLRDLAGETYRYWPQPERDLGQRIAGFFAHATEHGALGTVLIGSDSPNLPLFLIEQAYTALEHTDIVLGPATDGGYYLIGAKRFSEEVLKEVRWSTPHTLLDTVRGVQSLGMTLSLLPPWYDIDTADDLTTLSGHYAALRMADPAQPLSHTEAWLRQRVV